MQIEFIFVLKPYVLWDKNIFFFFCWYAVQGLLSNYSLSVHNVVGGRAVKGESEHSELQMNLWVFRIREKQFANWEAEMERKTTLWWDTAHFFTVALTHLPLSPENLISYLI